MPHDEKDPKKPKPVTTADEPADGGEASDPPPEGPPSGDDGNQDNPGDSGGGN